MSPATLWKAEDATSEAPLAGLRVVDMADEKGETCGRFLADLGADVIRVEPPGGARSRRLPPFHGTTSLSFAVRNANKRGVTLDLGAPGRSRAGAGAARVGGRVDRDGAAGDAGGAGPRRRRRAGPQPGARDHVDHRLRPERRLPRLGRQRRDPRGHERDPQPLGPGRTRSAAHAAGDGVRDDRDPGGVGDARRLLEPPGDRTRRSRRLLDPRGGDADHGPRVRRRLGEPRVRLPLDARASGGRPLPDLPVRGRLRARRRAGAAPVAGHARVARRARRVPGRALRHDPGAARGSGRVARAVRRAVRRPDEGRDRDRGPGARGAGRAGPRRLRGAGRPALRGARGVRRRRGRARACTAGCRADSSSSTGPASASATAPREPGEHNDELDRAAGGAAGAARGGARRRAAPAAGRACASSTSGSSSSATRSGGRSPIRART